MKYLVLALVAIVIVVVFRKKAGPAQTTQTQVPVPRSSRAIEIDGDYITIDALGFFGPFSQSPNSHYTVAWRDNHGNKPGDVVLLEGSKVLFQGQLQRPNDGSVSDSGVFVINDWKYTDSPSGTFYAFEPSGKIIIAKNLRANLINNGISKDGRFAACQAAHSESADGGMLCVFDLRAKRIVGRFLPVAGWASRYDFESDKSIVHLIYDDGKRHRYAFTGSFLDSETWETDKVKYASGYELVEIAEDS